MRMIPSDTLDTLDTAPDQDIDTHKNRGGTEVEGGRIYLYVLVQIFLSISPNHYGCGMV